MKKAIFTLLVAQFLSAFADNAILFAVIALVMQSTQTVASWYIPALQSGFFIAFVLLAPWVGGLADYYPKSRVLIMANGLKACGASLLFLGIEPMVAYCVVGIGAACYGPAKYGILPELAGHHDLVKVNSWIEGSTILAILLGMKIGAQLADYSIHSALLLIIALFVISAAIALWLPLGASAKTMDAIGVTVFVEAIGQFFSEDRSRFVVLGASLFWATAATVRMIVVVWAPLVLMARNANDIANLTLFLAGGIIVGSGIAPYLIPLEKLSRARLAAYGMGICIIALSVVNATWAAQTVLLALGVVGGLFIVPVNAGLQELGQQSIGCGAAVAMQNFFQNSAMLAAVGSYTLSASMGLHPVAALIILGVLVLLATVAGTLHLPNPQDNVQNNAKRG